MTFGNAFDHSLEGVARPIFSTFQHLTFGSGFDESTLPDSLQSHIWSLLQSEPGGYHPASRLLLNQQEPGACDFSCQPSKLDLREGLEPGPGVCDVTEWPTKLDDYSFNQSLDGVTWPIGLKRPTFGKRLQPERAECNFTKQSSELDLGL